MAEDNSQHDPIEDEPQEGFREFFATWTPAILAVIFIRLFIFEPFRIPSGSMVPTLLIGDHVLVTKFSYGVWLPFKSLGVPFSTMGLDDLGLDLPNVELLDLGDPERGDVIVFHYPQDEDITYIKRVVGLAGDTIRVVDNQIIIDGVKQERDLLGTFDDRDAYCRGREAKHWAESLVRSDGTVLDHEMLTALPRSGGLASPRREFVVPEDSVFVMGDNRDHSQDGRSWGFVRFDQIKGKAHFVWLSWNGCAGTSLGTFRFTRMFRSLYTSPPAPGEAAAAE